MEAKELIYQAFSKCKSALHKSELADAALQEALLKARLCRFQTRHTKHILGAANIYIKKVRWAIQQSKHKRVLSKRTYCVITVTKPGVHGVQCMQLFLWIEHH